MLQEERQNKKNWFCLLVSDITVDFRHVVSSSRELFYYVEFIIKEMVSQQSRKLLLCNQALMLICDNSSCCFLESFMRKELIQAMIRSLDCEQFRLYNCTCGPQSQCSYHCLDEPYINYCCGQDSDIFCIAIIGKLHWEDNMVLG